MRKCLFFAKRWLYVDFYPAVNRTTQRKFYFLAKCHNHLAKIDQKEKHERKKKHNLKVYGQSGCKYKETLTIIFKEQWIKEAGFEIGSRGTLECDRGIIVIKAADKCPEEIQ